MRASHLTFLPNEEYGASGCECISSFMLTGYLKDNYRCWSKKKEQCSIPLMNSQAVSIFYVNVALLNDNSKLSYSDRHGCKR